MRAMARVFTLRELTNRNSRLLTAVENFRDDRNPANTWGELELNDNSLRVHIFGNDTIASSSNRPVSAGRQWL